ncbi:MAG TPA: hypothetical protein VEV41_17695 [Terriglobales bacterium]|nr:hypothetical protein [Terriglobales bacterium]
MDAATNLQNMKKLDDSWNAQDLQTFRKYHAKDCIVRWPNQLPTHGVIDAPHLISERIGNPKARSRAEHIAARIGHCHLHELRIRCHIANAAIRLSHEIPQYSGQTYQRSHD